MQNTETLGAIARRFAISGNITGIKPLGNGLINDTLRVSTDGPEDYVLQRINTAIFKDVALLQHNIECVTAHIRRQLEAEGVPDIDRRVLRFLPCMENGRTWVEVDGEAWRLSVLIPDSYTHETVDPEHSRIAGLAFGEFQARLADLPDTLGETIPDFHNMELRARQLHEAVARDAVGRMAIPEVEALVRGMEEYEEEMCKAERLHREGLLPKRICHCDTKVNNILFDADGNVLCVIDLDTVMPSFVFSDYGDFLRTGANFTAEDDPDLSRVGFNEDIFKAFTKGYLESARDFLTPIEIKLLPYAVALFPYMQCVRFLADYINGDTYYKIKYPTHNLDRTRNQLALYRDVRSHDQMMADFIQGLM